MPLQWWYMRRGGRCTSLELNKIIFEEAYSDLPKELPVLFLPLAVFGQALGQSGELKGSHLAKAKKVFVSG